MSISCTHLFWVPAIAYLFLFSTATGETPTLLVDRSHHVELTQNGTTIDLQTQGYDPYLIWEFSAPLSSEHRVLQFDYFCPAGINQFHIYTGPTITEKTRIDMPSLIKAEGWQTYRADLVELAESALPESTTLIRLDLGMKPGVRIQLRDLHVRARTADEIREAAFAESRRANKIRKAELIRRYLASDVAIKALTVEVQDQQIEVTLPLDDLPEDSELELVEFTPAIPIGSDGIPSQTLGIRDGSELRFRLKRFTDGRDRLHSSWRLRGVTGSKSFLTGRRYATSIVCQAGHTDARNLPKSQKGISGLSGRGPIEELVELGVDAATINLVLTRFLSTRPGPGREKMSVPGAPLYFDPKHFAGYDRLLEFARQNDIVVSAIVLIPSSEGSRQVGLVHPETNGGVYAMPDLATERGVQIYAQVLDRIAQRYRTAEKSPGGISNWIVHNEIDFHPVWTNMGKQPPEVLTEAYYRSMRIVHNAATAHNPHAHVFASLTHHWNVSQPHRWKQLSPREFLLSIQRYSELEGDFAWGVAYHPYPESLFASVPWQDKNVSDDFDSPLITIQNLEVLGQFLQSDRMLDPQGKIRPVILSEQGFHSDSYSEEAQRLQASSLWYAMKKIKSLPWVESFHYHRWIDHPAEGGLKVGLRTLPTAEHRFGERKQAWKVYQAIGTERETEATKDLAGPN